MVEKKKSQLKKRRQLKKKVAAKKKSAKVKKVDTRNLETDLLINELKSSK